MTPNVIKRSWISLAILLSIFMASEAQGNSPPKAAGAKISADEDVMTTGTLMAQDPEGDSLTYTILSSGSKGVARIKTATEGSFTYTPNPNANGTDTFTFQVSDGSLTSNIATMTVSISPVNDAPVAGIQTVTVIQDMAQAVTLSASDVDGDLLSYELIVKSMRGTLTGTAPNLIYAPAPGFVGTEYFEYVVSDGRLSATGTVNINVEAPVQVVAGNSTTCAILKNASLWCWGYNAYGQLGIGNNTNQNLPQSVNLGLGRTAKLVVVGSHTCSILDDSSLKCWGYNTYGQLGIGNNTNQNLPQPVNLGLGRTAKTVVMGIQHTCSILDDSSLKCWGYNTYGQLGIGNNTNQNLPQPVNLGLGRTANLIAMGQYNTCSLLDDNSLKCWGYNLHGQLGIGNTINQSLPQPVNIGWGRTANLIAMGNYHTCAILDDSSLKCWGQNFYGQLGIGNYTDQSVPYSVNLGVGRKAISVAIGLQHTCSVLDDSSLKCWGRNNYGQLGIGSNTSYQNLPQSVYLRYDQAAKSVHARSNTTCSVSVSGFLMCWGDNYFGQLGNGNYTLQTLPQLVNLGRPTKSVVVGSHTCSILDDSSLKCWGFNGTGSLGIGNFTNQNLPQPVVFPSP